MGREVRRVPPTWQHPQDETGYIPLLDGFNKRLTEWRKDNELWRRGLKENWFTKEVEPVDADTLSKFPKWEDYYGPCPKAEDYMPDWSDKERTHYQMYETTTEGTPISPVFETPELLARWLVDNHASAFADLTASYDDWLRVARGGFAPSAVIDNGTLDSGVAGLTKAEDIEWESDVGGQ